MKSRMIGMVAAFALAVGLALTVTADDVTLPAGYTKLDYIESTGTQYIDTGLYPSDRLSITMEFGHFRWTGGKSMSGLGCLFGTISGANFYEAYVECINQNYGQKQLKFVGIDVGTVLDTAADDWTTGDVRLVIDGGDGEKNEHGKYVGTASISVNGGTPRVTSVETSASSAPPYTFCVFSRKNGVYPGAFRLYRMTATKADGGKFLDLVPCISPDGEIGVYDFARNGFLGNSGTGRFLTPSDAAQELVRNSGFDIGSVNGQGFLYQWQQGFSCENWTFKI